jgi:lipoprotein-anchoring transpeptidase ErfK/SrfK
VRRTAAVLAAGALLLLAGCNDEGGSSASGSSGAAAPAAQVTVSPADGATDVSPADPLEITVTGGELSNVTVTDASGAVAAGSVAEQTSDQAAATATAQPSATATTASASAASAASAGIGAASSGSATAGSASTSAGSATAGPATTEVWKPDDHLAYGTTYTVTAKATNADHQEATSATTFTTVRPRTQTTPSVGPLDGTTVGVGMPIRVYFDQPVTDKAAVESHLQVQSSTPTDGVWSWLNDSEVHFRPSSYWPANTDVTLNADLYGVDFGDGVWGEKDRTVTFHVGDKHVSVADAAAHTLTVYDGDQQVQHYPMSAGSTANPTRNGPHVVLEMRRNITMDSSTFGLAVDAPGGYRSDVEYATRISNNGEFVHAAPWSVGQQGSSNVSHGCINLSTDRAAWFFHFSQPGDVVEVKNSIGPTLSSVDGDIYDWAVPWDQWTAKSALK